jgi:hypothetical protein
MSRILNIGLRTFLRVFMPGIAADLQAEDQFALRAALGSETTDTSLYIDIEDNGAETTLVTFAGMAVLYAAMPKFEFKNMLQARGEPFNFVFVRDGYRSSYRLAPDGSGDGIAFYERSVREALNRIGARINIAIGMSGGGEAAFRISGAAPIHSIIAFNPGFPLEYYGARANVLLALFDAKKLVREPGAYLEVLLVVLSARFLWKRARRVIGLEDPGRPLRDYLRRAAPAVLYYSRGCCPDRQQALALKEVPSIRLAPLESLRHNCLAELKKKGSAAFFMLDAIQDAKTLLPLEPVSREDISNSA